MVTLENAEELKRSNFLLSMPEFIDRSLWGPIVVAMEI
jgi:hypothetical protein